MFLKMKTSIISIILPWPVWLKSAFCASRISELVSIMAARPPGEEELQALRRRLAAAIAFAARRLWRCAHRECGDEVVLDLLAEALARLSQQPSASPIAGDALKQAPPRVRNLVKLLLPIAAGDADHLNAATVMEKQHLHEQRDRNNDLHEQGTNMSHDLAVEGEELLETEKLEQEVVGEDYKVGAECGQAGIAAAGVVRGLDQHDRQMQPCGAAGDHDDQPVRESDPVGCMGSHGADDGTAWMDDLCDRFRAKRREESAELQDMEEVMQQAKVDVVPEARLVEQQRLLQMIINRMINKDRVILVSSAAPVDGDNPEGRTLVKHPEFPVAEGGADLAADNFVIDGSWPSDKNAKMVFQEYQRIGRLLIKYLADEMAFSREVKENDMIKWYIAKVRTCMSRQAKEQ